MLSMALMLVFLKGISGQNIRYQGRAVAPAGYEGMSPATQEQQHWSSPYYYEDTMSSFDDLESKLTKTGKWQEFIKKVQESGEKANGQVMEDWEEDAKKWAVWASKLDNPSVPVIPKTERSILNIAESEERPTLGMESYWASSDRNPHEGFKVFLRRSRRPEAYGEGNDFDHSVEGTAHDKNLLQEASQKMKYLQYLQNNHLPFSAPPNSLPPGFTKDMVEQVQKEKNIQLEFLNHPPQGYLSDAAPNFQNGPQHNYQNGPPQIYQNGPPPKYQNGQPLTYQNGPPMNYQNGPPPKYQDAPPPNYQHGPPPNYHNGPPPNYQDGPPPNYQDGLPPNYQDGPPPNYQDGQKPNYQAGPPPNYHNGPPPNYQDGPPPNYEDGLPPNYQDGPPPNYQDGPPPNYQDGPPPNYQAGPPPNYQNGPPPNYQYGPQSNYQAGPPPNHKNGPPPNYHDGQKPNYQAGPPPNHHNGPPQNYQDGPLPNYQDGPPPNYQEGPPPNYQDDLPPNYQDGPPPDYQNGAPKNYQNGSPQKYRNGPPPQYQNGPPPQYQNGPPPNYQKGPPQMYRNGPPPKYQNGPPLNYQNGPPSNYEGGPHPNYQNDQPQKLQHVNHPSTATVNPLASYNLPGVDDFFSPIRWVKFNSKQIVEGLAKVTDIDTGINKQFTINDTIYVPILDNNIERILGYTTTQVPLLSTNRTELRNGALSTAESASAHRDWLLQETMSDNAKKDFEPICEGDGCPARCQQLGCQSSCVGDTCSSGCVGRNCNSFCKGPGCLSMCIGDKCSSRCDGLSCDSRCQGTDCEASCQAFSCYQSVNGVLSRGAGDWNQWYPQYDEHEGQKDQDQMNNQHGGDSEGQDHIAPTNYEGPEEYNS